MTITNGYATRAQLAAHLDIDTDAGSSLAIDAAVNSASRAIDEYCGQYFYDSGSATARTFHPDSAWKVTTPPFHTLTGLVVKTDDGDTGTFSQTWTVTTDYIYEPFDGKDDTGRTVPWCQIAAVGGRRFYGGRRPRVQVTAKWGWAAVPDEVYSATLIKAARVFKRKDSPTGVEGGYEFGVVRVSYRDDPDVCMLLAPFRRLVDRVVL